MRRPRCLLENEEEDIQIKKGMHVLLSTENYRFWVHVADVLFEKQKIYGIICSQLSKYSSLHFGEVIQFKPQNVLASFVTG